MRHQNSLKIPYTSEGFPSEYQIGSRNLATSWDDILWAALTVGRPNVAYVFQHAEASLHEAIFRLSLIRMAIEQGPSGYLKRTSAFTMLDPTEKSAVSYFLGMTLCKLFASKLLKTHWLLHLDVFRDSLNPTLHGSSRPDLVGEDDCGKWHVFESKGRSSSQPLYHEKWKAKNQAKCVSTVNGATCGLRIGTFAYFKSEVLHFHWFDPEPEGRLIELVSPEQKWRFCYEPIFALVSNSETSIREIFRDSLQVFAEIHPEVHQFLSRRLWNEAHEAANELRNQFKELGFQPDGLRIKAGESWQLPFKSRFED